MRRAIVVGAGLLLASCASGGADQATGGGDVAPEAQQVGDAPAELPPSQGAAAPALPALAPAVIKDASLHLEVESGAFGGAVDRATAIASRYGGYVLSSTVAGDEAKRGSITLRVPADRFEDAIGDLRRLGTVRQESISGREVTQEFVDLNARLRNARAQQAVMLNLMGEAVTIQQTIHVQRELELVQLEIEELTGRLRFLRDRTALGTIVVEIAEVGAPTAPGVFGRAWDRAVDVFLGLAASSSRPACSSRWGSWGSPRSWCGGGCAPGPPRPGSYAPFRTGSTSAPKSSIDRAAVSRSMPG